MSISSITKMEINIIRSVVLTFIVSLNHWSVSLIFIMYIFYVYRSICSYIFLLFQASDWDKYAAEEYEMLVAEEGGNDAPEEM